MIDVARSARSEIAEIELAEVRLRAHFRLIESEVAEAADVRFVDAVFHFVVAVALTVALVADFSAVDASMTVKQMNAPVFVLMSENLKTC